MPTGRGSRRTPALRDLHPELHDVGDDLFRVQRVPNPQGHHTVSQCPDRQRLFEVDRLRPAGPLLPPTEGVEGDLRNRGLVHGVREVGLGRIPSPDHRSPDTQPPSSVPVHDGNDDGAGIRHDHVVGRHLHHRGGVATRGSDEDEGPGGDALGEHRPKLVKELHDAGHGKISCELVDLQTSCI